MAKKMIKNGKGGTFVNVSSQASKVALPDHTAYCKFFCTLRTRTTLDNNDIGYLLWIAH